MAELSLVDELNEEQRAELDRIEQGTPDLERQLRAAQVAVDTEEAEQRAAGAAARQPEGDAEDRERAELRSKVRLSAYVAAAVEQRAANGAELEYNQALGIAGKPLPARAPGAGRGTRHDRHQYRHHAAPVAGSPVRRDRRVTLGHHDGVGAGRGRIVSRDHGGRVRSAARTG